MENQCPSFKDLKSNACCNKMYYSNFSPANRNLWFKKKLVKNNNEKEKALKNFFFVMICCKSDFLRFLFCLVLCYIFSSVAICEK